MNKRVNTDFQYPFPAVPEAWGVEEKRFAQGLRGLFDIVFSRKLKNIFLADNSVNSRVIASDAVRLRHISAEVGPGIDLSSNAAVVAAQGTADQAVLDAAAAQSTADQAVLDAAAAQGTADQAVLDAAAAQGTADQAVLDAAAAKGVADQAVLDAAAAQGTADGVYSQMFPVGVVVLMNTAPTVGTWVPVSIGVTGVSAWQRTA